MNDTKRRFIIILSVFLVGFLHIGPPLAVHFFMSTIDMPFVLNHGVHRDELSYASRAREIYDGHFPPSDLYFDEQLPNISNISNPLPSLIFSGFIWLSSGNITTAYLITLFIFSGMTFLFFYFLGRHIFSSFFWAMFFAYVGALTPIAFRILNFDGA
ncbi:MAG: hypothetical protein AAB371_02735 [Patescibacteria group bacterium]